ncbi:MAG: type II toxin-antitoxin system HicB family antitoxin [Calditrichia bacterium]
MKLKVEFRKIHDHLYIGSCPDLLGCHVQANSRENVEKRLNEAAKLIILSFKNHHEKVPLR